MKCIQCEHIDGQASKEHTKVGFAKCKKQTLSGVFESLDYERECGMFQAVSADELETRVKWVAGLRSKQKGKS